MQDMKVLDKTLHSTNNLVSDVYQLHVLLKSHFLKKKKKVKYILWVYRDTKDLSCEVYRMAQKQVFVV